MIRHEISLVAKHFGTIPNRSLNREELAVFLEAAAIKKIEFVDTKTYRQPAAFTNQNYFLTQMIEP